MVKRLMRRGVAWPKPGAWLSCYGSRWKVSTQQPKRALRLRAQHKNPSYGTGSGSDRIPTRNCVPAVFSVEKFVVCRLNVGSVATAPGSAKEHFTRRLAG